MKRLLIICCLALLVSCKVLNPSQMLRTKSGYEYARITDSLSKEYRIAPDDIISFTLLPNKGERLISVAKDQTGQGYQSVSKSDLSFVIEKDGTARLPMLGPVLLGGLSKNEAETLLEQKFSAFINDPYVRISIDNRRVFVFRSGENSSVVKLENQNTTLFEVLAQSGGTNDSKAHLIKLIRKVNNVPTVYRIDLSKVENIDQGNIVLQSNDIIYLTPRDRIPEKIVAVLAPYLSILATAVAVIAIFK